MGTFTEEGAAKAKGGVKEAITALKTQFSILSTLAKDHGEVSVLLQRLQGMDRKTAEREELFQRIRRELLAHAHAEERTLYKRLEDYPQLKAKVEHSVEEHNEIEELLDALDDAVTSAAWNSTVSRLASAVDHHVHEEEHELFPQAGDVLDQQEADRLDRQFRQLKEEHLRSTL